MTRSTAITVTLIACVVGVSSGSFWYHRGYHVGFDARASRAPQDEHVQCVIDGPAGEIVRKAALRSTPWLKREYATVSVCVHDSTVRQFTRMSTFQPFQRGTCAKPWTFVLPHRKGGGVYVEWTCEPKLIEPGIYRKVSSIFP